MRWCPIQGVFLSHTQESTHCISLKHVRIIYPSNNMSFLNNVMQNCRCENKNRLKCFWDLDLAAQTIRKHWISDMSCWIISVIIITFLSPLFSTYNHTLLSRVDQNASPLENWKIVKWAAQSTHTHTHYKHLLITSMGLPLLCWWLSRFWKWFLNNVSMEKSWYIRCL